MAESILIELRESVAVVTIARPEKRNALSIQMLADIATALERAVSDGASAVVLTGGQELFSAGFDLAELGAGSADVAVDDRISATTAVVRDLPVPVIAAVEGACMGAGVELALSCDVLVVSKEAFFEVPAARLGILYRPDGVARLVTALGTQNAMRLLVLGERITGPDARSSGIAGHLTDPGTTLERAIELGARIAQAPRTAIAATKSLIRHVSTNDADVSHFESVRRELLDSEDRQRLVEQAQRKPGSR